MYVNDFDRNGSVEQIFCTNVNGRYYPVVDKDELLSQLPSFKKTLLYYRQYSRKAIDELMSAEVLDDAQVFEVKLLSSIMLLSDGKKYRKVNLPTEAQYSSVYGLAVSDFDGDGISDLIAGGNQFGVKPQFGRLDASNGWYFKGLLNDNEFSLAPGIALGVKGEIRGIEVVEVEGIVYILFAKYDDELEIHKILR